MSGPTPGPWELRGLTVFEAGKTAMSIAIATQHEANAKANARLIAAAPALLEALQGLLDASERHIFSDECLAERAAARAAIAAATGDGS